MEKDKKVNVFYVIIFLLAIVVMLVGVTFTYFSLAGKEEDDSTQIKTGTLSINYVDGKVINASDLYPVTEPDLNTEEYVYKKNFSVTSDGTLDQTLDMYIDITKNEFTSSDLMYALYDANGKKLSGGSLPLTGRLLMQSNVYLKSGETKSFTVLIWLNETGKNQNDQQDCYFKGEFDILANQIKYE